MCVYFLEIEAQPRKLSKCQSLSNGGNILDLGIMQHHNESFNISSVYRHFVCEVQTWGFLMINY